MTSAAPERHPPVAPPNVALAVLAAHRVGQPLHPKLAALGATFDRVTLTAPIYRLIALPGPGVPRGGIVAAGAGGTSVEVELHELPTTALGHLLAALPPVGTRAHPPADGEVLGMVCTVAPTGSVDISAWGSWPAYLAANAEGVCVRVT
jgi:allophanate hydrolase